MREPKSNLTDRPGTSAHQEYLKVPLHRERLRFETVNLEESIREFIGLILTTRPGGFRYDPDFGCNIWDQEFKYIKRGRFKEDVHKAVQEAVERYETRLKSVKAEISVVGLGEEKSEKKVVEIWVRGTIKLNNRIFEEKFEIDWDRGKKHSSP